MKPKNWAKILGMAVLLAVTVSVAAEVVQENNKPCCSWRYKMTVTVETPEGLKTGSAVRQMGNELQGSPLSQSGNPADVRGEAVVVDLGKRGVLFALISSDSDLEFYNAFPVPGNPVGSGGSTPEGIKYYASLPVGTKAPADAHYPPGYPKLVTFTDLNDPKSVTQAQVWERDDRGYFQLKEDRMEKLFGPDVKLKDITLEITNESVTWGVVDKYLPKILFEDFQKWWKTLPLDIKMQISDLLQFEQGEK